MGHLLTPTILPLVLQDVLSDMFCQGKIAQLSVSWAPEEIYYLIHPTEAVTIIKKKKKEFLFKCNK